MGEDSGKWLCDAQPVHCFNAKGCVGHSCHKPGTELNMHDKQIFVIHPLAEFVLDSSFIIFIVAHSCPSPMVCQDNLRNTWPLPKLAIVLPQLPPTSPSHRQLFVHVC